MALLSDKAESTLGALSNLGFGLNEQDSYSGVKGDILLKLEDGETGEVLEEHHWENVITRDYSILLARLAADNVEPRHGIFALAVGTGDVGWDLQNPPAPQDTQRSLYNEIERKTFSEVQFRRDDGSVSSIPTNVVDFKTVFTENEAVGAIVEMGLLGGDVVEDMNVRNPITPPNGPYDDTVDHQGKDTLVNSHHFPVVNKPSSAKMSITWRITH